MMADPKKPRALEEMDVSDDARLSSPSAGRNKGPLIEALRETAEGAQRVLELLVLLEAHQVAIILRPPRRLDARPHVRAAAHAGRLQAGRGEPPQL